MNISKIKLGDSTLDVKDTTARNAANNAVQYTTQSKTDSEKQIAAANIGMRYEKGTISEQTSIIGFPNMFLNLCRRIPGSGGTMWSRLVDLVTPVPKRTMIVASSATTSPQHGLASGPQFFLIYKEELEEGFVLNFNTSVNHIKYATFDENGLSDFENI